MSIIHNALKKTQEQLNAKDNTINNPVLKPQTPTQTLKKKPQPLASENLATKKPKAVLLGILYFILVVMISFEATYIYSSVQKNQSQLVSSTSSMQPVTTSIKEPTVSTNTANTQASTTVISDLKLNGTMIMGTKTVALINDNTYEVGQEINGAIITEITPNQVSLERKGESLLIRK
ncbi:MAG: hypothetical protein ACI9F2_000827 [Lysobacterales bacterium]|jgi:hypothetical protein